MRPGDRLASIDALRALALMPVVVVNLSGYSALPDGGPLAALAPADSVAAWVVAALLAGLLQGKGLAFLTFLFGYSLVLGTRAKSRVDRVMGIGLVHGFFLYCGDILSTYAAAGYAALKFRHGPLRRLRRRMVIWAGVGLTLVGLTAGLLGSMVDAPAADTAAAATLSLAAPQAFGDWLASNAKTYAIALLGTVFVYLPLVYAVVLGGVYAARLRLLSHRRWRGRWQAWARWAPAMLLVNLAYGVAMANLLRSNAGAASAWSAVMVVLGPLTMLTWVPWLLLRRLPVWLSMAGRNTLSMYIGSSLVAVVVLSGVGWAWQPGTVLAVLFALSVWAGLAMVSAGAAARGWRLPLEAWLARRPAALPPSA
jgi:uncharacterized protein